MEKSKKYSQIFLKLVLIIFVIFSISILFESLSKKAFAAGAPINVWAPKTDATIEKQSAGDAKEFSWKKAWEKLMDNKEEIAGAAFKKAVSAFLKQVAYDTATYLATGDKGQKPMFYTEGWGKYLGNVADNAAGTFLEELGRNPYLQFNLCEPDFNVQVKIGLGLQSDYKPKIPACTFSEMKNNWEEELNNPNFLNRFQDMFINNDLGIALKVRSGMENKISEALNSAAQDRTEGEGFKAVTEGISGYIKSPAKSVIKAHDMLYEDATKKELTWTGTVADAIDTFTNTLISKLLDRLLKRGLVSKFADNGYQGDWGSFSDIDASPYFSGVKGAKDRFRTIVEPEFGVRGDYNIIGELTACPDPSKAGPTNCVITSRFGQAVTNKMTVGEAMKEGFLNPGGIFGFTSDGFEPSYQEGYPYRSMIILRKFRILPVSWELAAQFIKDNPEAVSQGGSGGTKNLESLVNCFSDDDEYGLPSDTLTWCQGLIDPNWVLKAPLNYCKREGPGPEKSTETVIGEGQNSKMIVSRNDNYCADEQTCIKEESDGSCLLYGYCSQERRKWNYGNESCEPENNTCNTFRSRDGQTNSYLENTLDFATCSISNVGCKDYCEEFDFTTDNYTCSTSTGNKLYVDKDAKICDISSEGCHEFVRTKGGVGSNLLKNTSFEIINASDFVDDGVVDTFDYWGAIASSTSDSFVGFSSAMLAGPLVHVVTIDPVGFNLSFEDFTFSFYAKDCGTASTYTFGVSTNNMGDFSSGNWRYFSATYAYPITAGNQVSFTITPDGTNCKIDAIKLERGSKASVYADYRDQGLIYEKLAPDYLNCNGVSDPVECNDFVRKCNVDEVGCDLYTAATDGMTVPGKVAPVDQCPSECVGYDKYLQSNTYFDSARLANFIPSTAQSCSAETNGCDEFTNLDKLGEGAEAREYYSQLRQCTRKNDPISNCNEFYTWEGSAETGYQLRVFTLNTDNDGDDGLLPTYARYSNDPAVTSADYLDCSSSTYAYLPSNPLYNSDCREFYNTAGDISYHLYSLTVTCSDNCHPYRRTDVNIDPLTGLHDCKNGGVWNTEHSACIYMAIPGQGKKCSASQAGCREYSGNTGNNIQLLFINDFEGNTQGWYGLGGSNLALSSNALMAGGESLEVTGGTFSMAFDVGNLVHEKKSYLLQFLANAPVDLKASIENSTTTVNFLGTSTAQAGEWDVYELNLASLDHTIYSNERLVITATGNFNIDDIRLTEIRDRYFLIKESWQTPVSCYDDIYGNYQGPDFNLGCDEYFNRYGDIFYLHDFSKLCDESAVGCELMIDTHNYEDYNGKTFHPLDDSEEIVPADSYDYIVYNQDKFCNSADKGCQRLGEMYQYGDDYRFGDTYLKNNPSLYDTILCYQDEKNCEEWSSAEGNAYFKDPVDMTCDYRQQQGAGDNWAWYKRKVKRCDNIIEVATGLPNGKINTGFDALSNLIPLETTLCKNDSDCGAGISCILDDNDYLCRVVTSPVKTIGYGGVGNIVRQPTRDVDNYNWVGVCSASQSGCTEFIDPVSSFSPNLIFNSNYSDIDGDAVLGDGWSGLGPWSQELFNIEPFTLYKFGAKANSGAIITLTCNSAISFINGNNNVIPAPGVNSIAITVGSGSNNRLVYSNVNTSCIVSTTILAGSIELKQAVLAYQLQKNIDKESCNGQVDFDEGCVLFNQRNVTGASGSVYNYNPLIFDAASTTDDGLASPCINNDCNSNVLLKVSPDRDCSEWLACRSMVENEAGDNVCLDIGLCNNVDNNGVCKQFIIEDKAAQEISVPGVNVPSVSNATGYSKVGFQGVSEYSMRGDYQLGTMDQEGNTLMLANGNFEIISDNKYPIGWNMDFVDRVWKKSYFSIIDNPIEAQESGVGFAPEGRAFLKAGEFAGVISDFVDISPNLRYVVSAKMNTISLSGGEAKVTVITYDTLDNEIGVRIDLSLGSGKDWEFKQAAFTTVAAATKAKVLLHTTGIGNYYIDEIKIRPTLEIRSNEFVSQTCRLYPSDDSLSCDYQEDSGLRKKGWWGYCLEHDRYPGNKDACLMWWPVDRVAGDGIGEQVFNGYDGKYPLYYCDNIDANFTFVEHREEIFIKHTIEHDGNWFVNLTNSFLGFWDTSTDIYGAANTCPAEPGIAHGGYQWRTETWVDSGFWTDDIHTMYYCQPLPSDHVIGHWYRYNGNLIKFAGLDGGGWDETIDGVKIYDPTFSGDPIDPAEYNIKCHEIWQTVNSTGSNKAWLDRVHSASEYEAHTLDYGYEQDDPSFGSAVPPEPLDNPYEWDGDAALGVQPLYYLEESSNQARAGSPYNCNGNQCANLGRCDITDEVCIYVNQNVPGGVTHYCPIDNSNPCYENWKQAFLACPQGEQCLPDLNNIDLVATPVTPNENLKRMFAESYGAWQWQGNDGNCQAGANAGNVCDYKGNQCPGGTCEARCKMNFQQNGLLYEVFNNDGSGNIASYPTCNPNVVGSCNGILYNGSTAAVLTAANTCTAATAVCGSGGAICIAANCAGLATSAEIAACTAYYTSIAIPGNFLCSTSLHSCDSTKLGECSYTPTCEYNKCVGGASDGGSCNAEHICTGSYCALETTLAGRYRPIKGGWDVPTRLCMNSTSNPSLRPVWIDEPVTLANPEGGRCWSGGVAGSCFDCNPFTEFCDYCAVAPLIYHLRVDNNDGNITSPNVEFADNKLINFTFNTYVDPSQTPLVGYFVNWGDGEATVVTGVEMYDKPDTDNPHSLYHIYDYWGLRTKFVQGNIPDINCADANTVIPNTGGLSCGISNCCAVKPRVKIKDNWGYCNNACNGLTDNCTGVNSGPCPAGNASNGYGYVPWGADWGTDPFIIVSER